MATESYQVTCITKRGGHYNPHERIEGIGGYSAKQWWLSEDEAIRAIKDRKYAFYVSVNGKSVWVVVANHHGREYLKTEPDNYAPDNLLNLADCPR
jgi:hypothetical protein